MIIILFVAQIIFGIIQLFLVIAYLISKKSEPEPVELMNNEMDESGYYD
jgi:hypothetical protein